MPAIDYTVATRKGYSDAIAAVIAATEAHGFKVQFVHDVAATLAEKGFHREPVTIVELCNARFASQVLEHDVKIGLMLPCPIMVYVEDGTVNISTMRPSLIGGFFPEAGIGDVAAEVEVVMVDIIDEASGSHDVLRIAVPTEDEGGAEATRSMHFGHSASFTLVDVADGAIVATSVLGNGPHEHGACGSIVDVLAAEGVGAVIAGGMGGGPRVAFADAGIPVFFDAESPTPRAAVEAYLAGAQETFGETHQCRGH
jgi:uncharacterized protein (DUF302 family)/predicted Fe-Mo cluster-binding NifX family protein